MTAADRRQCLLWLSMALPPIAAVSALTALRLLATPAAASIPSIAAAWLPRLAPFAWVLLTGMCSAWTAWESCRRYQTTGWEKLTVLAVMTPLLGVVHVVVSAIASGLAFALLPMQQ